MKRSALKPGKPLERKSGLSRGKGLQRTRRASQASRVAQNGISRAKVCAECGTEFVPRDECVSRERKFCSRECTWASQRAAARASLPPLAEVKALYAQPGSSDRGVAAHYGRSLWWTQKMRRAYGIPAPRPSTPPKLGEEMLCEECGASFYVKRSRLGDRRYCSAACKYARDRRDPAKVAAMAERLSRDRRGAGNPAWKGGVSEQNRPRKSKFSLKVKGEYCCRNCGAGFAGLHLHHVIPRSLFRAGREEILNGVPLCEYCHIGWHRRRVTIHREIFTTEEWKYLTSVQLTGQNIEAWLDDRYPPRVSSLAA